MAPLTARKVTRILAEKETAHKYFEWAVRRCLKPSSSRNVPPGRGSPNPSAPAYLPARRRATVEAGCCTFATLCGLIGPPKGEFIMSLVDFVSPPKFEEYKERFKQHYKLQRRKDGVILVEAHTKGGPIQLSVENHRSVGQLFKTIGADPENEVMIFTGTGKEFMMDADPEGFKLEQEDLQHWAYEYAYKDGRINVSSLINDLEIPTIGVLNGPGFHTEICLMCDITICCEDAIIFDLHYKFPCGSRD